MPTKFDVNKFLKELVLNDSTHTRSFGSRYLDDCGMGEDLTFSGGVLSVEKPDGSTAHYKIVVTPIDPK